MTSASDTADELQGTHHAHAAQETSAGDMTRAVAQAGALVPSRGHEHAVDPSHGHAPAVGHSYAVGHAHGGGVAVWAFAGLLGVAAAVYLVLALRQRRRRRPWSARRTTGFLAGSALCGAALFPEVVPFPEGDFREHMLQHLVIGMIAPVLLVLAAPMTLLMRSISVRSARRLTSVLRSRVCHGIAHPVVALTLNVGGMGALYFSPLYEVMLESPAVHLLVHVHFLAAGCLFAWVIAGPDPGPRRPSVPARLVVLGVAITVHATLSQLLYAGLFVSLPVSSQELRGGAELMYYGGDIAELLLAFALVSAWKPRRSAAATRAAATGTPPAGATPA